MTVLALTMLGYTRLPVDGSYWPDLLPLYLIFALGLAFGFIPVTIAGFIGVPPQQAAPPRWKQAVVIWLTFFPLSLALGSLLLLTGLELNIVLRTFLTTLVATPIMTYALLPWMTRRFEWWLKPSPAG